MIRHEIRERTTLAGGYVQRLLSSPNGNQRELKLWTNSNKKQHYQKQHNSTFLTHNDNTQSKVMYGKYHYKYHFLKPLCTRTSLIHLWSLELLTLGHSNSNQRGATQVQPVDQTRSNCVLTFEWSNSYGMMLVLIHTSTCCTKIWL